MDTIFSNSARTLAAAWMVGMCSILWAPCGWTAPFSGMMFEDVPALPPDVLLPAWDQALGQPIDDALPDRLASELTALYRSRGYLPPAPRLVRVHEPAGIVVMEVREAHLANVHVDGREHVDSDDFWALLQELRNTRPLSRAAFDAWLQQANRFDFEVRGALVRLAADSSAYLASLSVSNRRWQGVVHVDNRGPAQLGHEIAQISVLYRWPRETFGHLRADVAAAVDHERLRYAGISGAHRLMERGDSLQWSYARSESTLPIPDTTRSVDYERERAELAWRTPLVRRLRQRADVSLTLRSYDLDQFLDDGRRLRRDRIRAVDVGYRQIVARETGGRYDVDLALSQGLEGLGASLSPSGAEQAFTVLTGRYRYSRKLAEAWKVWSDVQFQVSEHVLPSSERFFIGGRSLGGAFDPATLSGDQGLGARVGIDRSFTVRGNQITAFAYYDHGYVRSHDEARPADDAGSVGLGFRGTLAKLSWSLELGLPAVEPETPTLLEDEPRLFFALTQQF